MRWRREQTAQIPVPFYSTFPTTTWTFNRTDLHGLREAFSGAVGVRSAGREQPLVPSARELLSRICAPVRPAAMNLRWNIRAHRAPVQVPKAFAADLQDTPPSRSQPAEEGR